MRRKIIWTILGAVLLVLLVALLWWWFLGREPQTPSSTGSLGGSGDRTTQQQGTTQPPTNIGSPIPSQGGTLIGGTTQGSGGSGSTGGSGGSGGSSASSSIGRTTTPGVSWLGGGGPFSPTPINAVNSANPTAPLPTTESGGAGGGNSGINNALLGGIAYCSQFLVSAFTGALTTAVFAVQVNVPTENTKHFMDCMARMLARFALQQMTTSILKWINSGFNGQPAFVQNYQRLFLNVADKAVGEFIRGSSLSFLCTPFRAPVRVAIAQSYARRGASGSSCTLSQVLGGSAQNVNSFLSGNFSSGGWQGLLSFTTSPSNNPFGAYSSARLGAEQSISLAQQDAERDLSYGRGFLSYREPYNCKPTGSGDFNPTTGEEIMVTSCQYRITTPGSVIQPSVNTALGTSYRQLELAKTFDETISLLIQQLITQSLYSGLSNLNTSGSFGGSPLLSAEAQALLATLQNAVTVAQQYGYTKQGAITDIQNAQSNLKNLANCYEGRGDTVGKDSALNKISELEARVTALNNDITHANAAIAALEVLQTRTLATKSAAEVGAVANDFSAAQTAGSFITDAEVTGAQQDRTTLQSEMTTLNQTTSSKQNQCYAGN